MSDVRVVEIMRNADGSLWIDRAGVGMELISESFDEGDAALVLTACIGQNGTGTGSGKMIEGILGILRARVVGLLPPISTSPVFAIRKHVSSAFTLDDYRDMGVIDSMRSEFVIGERARILSQMEFGHPVEVLKHLVRERKNVLIVGPAGSGKTTLANTLLNEVSEQTPGDRLVILEDAAELQTSIRNKISLTTSMEVDMRALLRITMRLRPDRIIIGEIRGWEAYTLLKAWTSGHPGGVATLHASDSQEALSRLTHYIFEEPAAQCFSSDSIGRMISSAVDVVVVIGKANNAAGRRVHEICEVRNFMNGQFAVNILKYQAHSGKFAFKNHQ
ncbi:ATPase, T2SS/T4P/T4SS family [Burkholderia cenocepacia]|uniref:ATPase, T2SS/T4P/T4SS family n=1 Tax=Burkholderia cenocepacia TaxID=95486 RepID=UPI002AB17C72|nr:ATPase, T2SS/T4P/T4SS family [Burkholderia cenocepacia]